MILTAIVANHLIILSFVVSEYLLGVIRKSFHITRFGGFISVLPKSYKPYFFVVRQGQTPTLLFVMICKPFAHLLMRDVTWLRYSLLLPRNLSPARAVPLLLKSHCWPAP